VDKFSRKVRQSLPANVVQEILGHANFGTTMNIYGHVLPSMQRDAMADLDDFFRGTRQGK
jgi:integrase